MKHTYQPPRQERVKDAAYAAITIVAMAAIGVMLAWRG